jgi:GT2 family glycosyltransferase
MITTPANLRKRAVSSATPSVAVVLLNWNSTADTLACIESVRNLAYKSFQTVIVDNGS